jgi:CheY-like chemotaxis protein
MDLEMPEMDGAACCRTIKANPAWAAIPVVMITARGDEASQRHCRSAGCDEFLTKPLERSSFLATAGRFVREIELREERKPVHLPGTINFQGTAYPCTIRDLSLGGALIAAQFQTAVARVVKVCCTLPDGSPLECQGKIVWSRGPGAEGRFEFGVSFLLPPRSMKEALALYLKGLTGS